MLNEYTVVNKVTGEAITLPAPNEEYALITVFILKEENGEQAHYPHWYRKKMIIISLSDSNNEMILDKWSIKVERKT